MNATLPRNTVFILIVIIELEWGHTKFTWASTSMTGFFIQREEGHLDTKNYKGEKRPGEDGGRDWNKPSDAKCCQQPAEARQTHGTDSP